MLNILPVIFIKTNPELHHNAKIYHDIWISISLLKNDNSVKVLTKGPVISTEHWGFQWWLMGTRKTRNTDLTAPLVMKTK